MTTHATPAASIAAELRDLVEGEVLEGEALAPYATDYGQTVHRAPLAAVRPRGVEDVSRVVRFAAERGIAVATRGVGHSTGGQPLVEGGIVMDLGSLNRIHEVRTDEGWFEADAGVLWADVLDATTPLGFSPPVLTGYPHVSVGGTLSAAGWGASSFRRGAQIDHCLMLEVVTGTGEIVRREPGDELFDHALGGLGQLGIITRVRHALRRHAPVLRGYTLAYNDLGAFLDAGDRLTADGRADHVEGVIGYRGEEDGTRRWSYTFEASVEVESAATPPDEALAGGRCERISDAEPLAFVRDIPRQDPQPGIAHPWLVTFLPRSTARQYLELCLQQLPLVTLGGQEALLRVWPAFRHSTRMPMVRLPDEESMLMLLICPTIPARILPATLAVLGRASDLAIQLGGKRYIPTWTHFDLPRWRLHFGDLWPRLNELKHRYDPHGILNPGFIQYED